jgi:hypothetical protein
MRVLFAALHESGCGTSRLCSDVRDHGEYWRVSGPSGEIFTPDIGLLKQKSGYVDRSVRHFKEIDDGDKNILAQGVIFAQIILVKRTIVRFRCNGEIKQHSMANWIRGRIASFR